MPRAFHNSITMVAIYTILCRFEPSPINLSTRDNRNRFFLSVLTKSPSSTRCNRNEIIASHHSPSSSSSSRLHYIYYASHNNNNITHEDIDFPSRIVYFFHDRFPELFFFFCFCYLKDNLFFFFTPTDTKPSKIRCATDSLRKRHYYRSSRPRP